MSMPERRTESQTKQVLEYIKAHGSITRREALKLRIVNLPARIAELKKKCDIITDYDYFLDENSRRVKFAIYRLASEEDLV